MKPYDDLMRYVLNHGSDRGDRTETGTVSIFAYTKALVFRDVANRFPAIFNKNLAWRSVMSELLWFLSGSTNLNDLRYLHYGTTQGTKKTIWDDNYYNEGKALGYSNGEMGPIYGEHMYKQLARVMEQIRKYPLDRRLVMSNWQEDYLDKMTLPPCHGIHTQFYVQDGKLHLSTTMRSCDIFLGLPFNIASYSAMLCMVASDLGLEAGDFKMFLTGDVHIYKNHIAQCEEYLSRDHVAQPVSLILPDNFKMSGVSHLCYDPSEFVLQGYTSAGKITAPMAFKKN